MRRPQVRRARSFIGWRMIDWLDVAVTRCRRRVNLCRTRSCGHRSFVARSADLAANLIQFDVSWQFHGFAASQARKNTRSPLSEDRAKVIWQGVGVDGPPSKEVVFVSPGEVQVFEMPFVLTFRIDTVQHIRPLKIIASSASWPGQSFHRRSSSRPVDPILPSC